MGMFKPWKCPRCCENPCRCEFDTYGDERLSGHYARNVRLAQRQVELAEERNRLLRELLDQERQERD